MAGGCLAKGSLAAVLLEGDNALKSGLQNYLLSLAHKDESKRKTKKEKKEKRKRSSGGSGSKKVRTAERTDQALVEDCGRQRRGRRSTAEKRNEDIESHGRAVVTQSKGAPREVGSLLDFDWDWSNEGQHFNGLTSELTVTEPLANLLDGPTMAPPLTHFDSVYAPFSLQFPTDLPLEVPQNPPHYYYSNQHHEHMQYQQGQAYLDGVANNIHNSCCQLTTYNDSTQYRPTDIFSNLQFWEFCNGDADPAVQMDSFALSSFLFE